jgi:hypothetical protein
MQAGPRTLTGTIARTPRRVRATGGTLAAGVDSGKLKGATRCRAPRVGPCHKRGLTSGTRVCDMQSLRVERDNAQDRHVCARRHLRRSSVGMTCEPPQRSSGPAAPHPGLHPPRQTDHRNPRQDSRHARPRPIQRADRIGQHQDPATDSHRVRVPLTQRPNRSRHAQPRRTPTRPTPSTKPTDQSVEPQTGSVA